MAAVVTLPPVVTIRQTSPAGDREFAVSPREFVSPPAPPAPQTFEEILPATRSCVRGGSIRWTPASCFSDTCRGKLVIRMRKESTEYRVEEFAADGGRGFFLTKAECTNPADKVRTVFIADPATADAGYGTHSCECLGFLRHGNCKHIDGILAIIENEFLWGQQRPAEVVATIPEPMPAAAPASAPAAKKSVLTAWDREQENFRW